MITNFTLKGICLLLIICGCMQHASAFNNPESRSWETHYYRNSDSVVAQGSANECGQGVYFTTTASGNWVHAKEITGASADTTNYIASIKDNDNFGSFRASYYTSNSIRLMPSGKPYLNRNITIVPSKQGSFADPVTVRLYFTKAEFDALKAADNTIRTVYDLSIMKTKDTSCMQAASSFYVVVIPTTAGVFGSANSGYYIEFTTYSFGTFFIAGSKSTVAPSFMFTSLNGTYNNGATQISWGTAYEIVTRRYFVQRSTDSVNFETIDSVPAKDAAINSYYYTDAHPPKGTAYYRFKITNSINIIQYSPVFAVSGPNLLQFNATWSNKTVQSKWNVYSAKGIKYFLVEKRSGGPLYTDVGSITTNDSIGYFKYTYTDNYPMASISYYRLKIVNKDNSIEYSQEVEVGSDLRGKIILYPSPAYFYLTIAYERLTNISMAELFSIDGRSLKTYELPAGSTQFNINVGALAQGVYIIIVNGNGKKITRRFVKD